MKKISVIITGIVLILITRPVDAQPVTTHGKLSVSGTHLVDQKGEVVLLHGVSYGWHNWWPRFYNRSTVKWLLEDWGCTVVRAATF